MCPEHVPFPFASAASPQVCSIAPVLIFEFLLLFQSLTSVLVQTTLSSAKAKLSLTSKRLHFNLKLRLSSNYLADYYAETMKMKLAHFILLMVQALVAFEVQLKRNGLLSGM